MLVLLVASVPVALPAVMSVTLALGALALSKQKAIVSRLSAIDELAGVDILCSDKTGTLTQNKLTLSEPIPFGGTRPEEIVIGAALATKAGSEDALDEAVLKAVPDPKALAVWRQTALVPFDPVSKRTMTTVVDPKARRGVTPRARRRRFRRCASSIAATETAYDAKVEDLAKHGFRALGVASSEDDGKTWKLLGILSLLDPPRPDAASTIAQTKKLGLEVKMVTGDDVAIGSEICSTLGLGTHLLVAGDVFPKGTDPDHIPLDAAHAVERADGFARVFPEHKFEIVKSLQQTGHIVAMTGDGVNDAPALKQADCGIAVSGATDAARSAAALILTAPGLSTIVNAIDEARKIFERITSYVYYRIAMTIAIMLVVVMSSVIFNIQPLTAIMIVVLALLDDIPIMTIAYDNVGAAEAPVRWNMDRILIFSGLMGLMATAQSLRPRVHRHGMDERPGPDGVGPHRSVASADDALPPVRRRRPYAAVRRAVARLDGRAALAVGAAVRRHRRDPDRGRADVRLWRPCAGAAVAADRGRVGLCDRLDDPHGHREDDLQRDPGRAAAGDAADRAGLADPLTRRSAASGAAGRRPLTFAVVSGSSRRPRVRTRRSARDRRSDPDRPDASRVFPALRCPRPACPGR